MSSGQEILSFLMPDFNEPVQLIFFWLMLSGLLSPAILAWIAATPKNWEKKWNSGTIDDYSDDLDAEHGSVSDISAAVATRREKLSEAMPGILLILGLLGTFVGLGLALDKASTILGGANAIAMDDSMVNLMGMMQGLGTKFKTSTWGITAFLSLKILNSIIGFEENRLRWCIRKMKGELDSKRSFAKGQQDTQHNQFLEAIGYLGENLCLVLREEVSGNRDVLGANQHHLVKIVELAIENNATGVQKKGLLTSQLGQANSIIQQGIALQEALCATVDKWGQHLNGEFLESRRVLENIQNLMNMNMSISEKNIAISEASKNLLFVQVEKSEAIMNHGLASRVSLENFVKANSENLKSMESSSSQMADAASRVGESAEDLSSAISRFEFGVTDVLGSLKTDLNATMEQVSQQSSEAAKDLKSTIGDFQNGVSEVMKKMKEALGSSISNMNDSFGDNMGKMSTDLGLATANIAKAINELSVSVGNTMESVESAIGESLKIQKNAQAEFLLTSGTLNENVIAMTGLVNKLQDDIKSGLTAVSVSNRTVASLNGRYATITGDFKGVCDEIVNAMADLVNRLQENMNFGLQAVSENNRNVASLNNRYSTTTEDFKEFLNEMIKPLNDHVECMKTSKDSDMSHKALSEMLARISSIDDNVTTAIQDILLKQEHSEVNA